jgi:hypothetical protein
MKTYSFFTEDSRLPAPTLAFVNVCDEARARELARVQLQACDHHVAVEVWSEDRLLFCLRRDEP